MTKLSVIDPLPTAPEDDDQVYVVRGDGGSPETFTEYQGTVGDLRNSGALTPFDRGTISTGTETPEPGDGAMQIATNAGAHTLAAPTTTGAYVLTYTNSGSPAAGAITASGWDSVVEIIPGQTAETGDVTGHTVENSVIEYAAYNDGVSKRLIATLVEDATP